MVAAHHAHAYDTNTQCSGRVYFLSLTHDPKSPLLPGANPTVFP